MAGKPSLPGQFGTEDEANQGTDDECLRALSGAAQSGGTSGAWEKGSSSPFEASFENSDPPDPPGFSSPLPPYAGTPGGSRPVAQTGDTSVGVGDGRARGMAAGVEISSNPAALSSPRGVLHESITQGHPPAEPGEEFQCPFMLIKAAMDAQDAAEKGLPIPPLPTGGSNNSGVGGVMPGGGTSEDILMRLPSALPSPAAPGVSEAEGDAGGSNDDIARWRQKSGEDSIRLALSLSMDTVQTASSSKDEEAPACSEDKPAEPVSVFSTRKSGVESPLNQGGTKPSPSGTEDPADSREKRSDSRGKERSDSRGKERSDSRGKERSDSRGKERSDSRGKERSDSRGKERSDSRGKERSDSRGKERSDSRGKERPDSRGKGRSSGPSSRAKITSKEEAEMQRQLAELTCPMTGFKQRRNSNGALSESSGGSARSGSTKGSVRGSHRGSHVGSRGSSNQSKAGLAAGNRIHESGPPSRMTSAYQSGMTGRSSKRSGAVRTRRVHKLGQFSVYEASRYEPLIRSSWNRMLETHSRAQLGAKFFQRFFDDNSALHGMFQKASDVMGDKFASILEDIVGAVEDVSLMKSKLKALSTMHLRVGVTQEHAVRMGQSLWATYEGILGDEWTSEIRAAWEWLWSWLSQLLHQSLEDARNEATILTYSWDLALDSQTEEEMGELLFDTLFELAPNLKPVYRKPRQILSARFVEMMSTLVSFHGDPMMMEEQITWLGFRHIKYGAKKQHVRVMGDVLIETMARAVGEDWTMDMAEAWNELWIKCCDMMMNTIDDASSYGGVVQTLWSSVRAKTTANQFGSTLRKMLLSGTEWVSSLSHGILEHSPGSPSVTNQNLSAKIELAGLDEDSNGVGSKSFKTQKGKQDSKFVGTKAGAENGVNGAGFQVIFDDPSKGGNSTESDAIGTHFWQMLTELLDLLWQPEAQNERLIVMTTMLFHWGIRGSHLETIGSALFATMKKVLGGTVPESSEEAWTWWWEITARGMAKTLSACEKNHAKAVRNSWELCKQLKTPIELGEVWFKELARMAPHVLHLFKRPREIQAAQFMAVVDMLVTFVEEPAVFFDGFKALTIRHLKYGVKADYAKAFGRSILIGIERTLDDKYDDHIREAWTMLWVRASSCVARALNVGTNPVIVSLVQGDLDRLCDAMDCASRGERFEWLTQVDINGEILSPLYWSLCDGNFHMASYIMSDLLMIRADREAYYYGREVLFAKHPDIIFQLCRDAPSLLCDSLFEGLMWHSKDVENGHIRVNYYIKELFGDPDKDENVWNQALCILAENGTPEMFKHPVVQKVLDVKWNQFGRRLFASIQIFYIFLLALFMIGSIEYHDECKLKGVRFLLGGISTCAAIAQTWLVIHHWKNGMVQKCKFGPIQVQIPRYLSQFWSMIRFISTWMLIVASFMEMCDSGENMGNGQALASEDGVLRRLLPPKIQGSYAYAGKAINAFLGMLLWIQLLQALLLYDRLSALTFKLGALFSDIARNLVVVSFLCLGFAAAFTCLDLEHFDRFGDSTTVLVRFILHVEPPSLLDMQGLGLFFLCVFSIVITLGMLNVLLAQLRATYGNISTNMQGFSMQCRAEICAHMESLLPAKYRRKLFDSMEFDKPVPFSIGDSGPAGGVQVMEPAKIRNQAYYRPDRVLRYTGEADSSDPWPSYNRRVEEYSTKNEPEVREELYNALD